MSDNAVKYDNTSRFLHWFSAIIILWATVSGIAISSVEFNAEVNNIIANFNVSVTTLLIPFFIWRMVHRLKHKKPAYTSTVSKAEMTLAKTMHIVLYIITGIVLASGLLMMEHSLSVFGLITLPNMVDSPSLLKQIDTIHIASTRILATLVLLHVVAVVKHQITGVNVLKRMM